MKRFLTKIYAYKFFDDLLFIYPLYAVMFIDHGISAFQISILLVVWSVTAFLLEVPSGVLADKYSRKYILFLGQIMRALGLLTWIVFPNFTGFLIGLILWGIESAFSSGTFEAFVYDELKLINEEKHYSKIIGRAQSFSSIAIVVASLGASVAILLGYPFVLMSSIGSIVIASIIILSLPEAKKVESLEDQQYFTFLKTGLRQALQNPMVFKLIMFLAAGLALSGALDEFWPIYVNEVGLPNYSLGLFIAVWAAVGASSSFVAHKFEKVSNRIFYFLFALNGVLLLTAGILMKPMGLLFLFTFSFLFGIMGVVFQTKLQHAIPSETRATTFSVKGFFVEVEAVLIYFVFGILANEYSYQYGFKIFGVVVVCIGLVYLFFSFQNLSPKLFLRKH